MITLDRESAADTVSEAVVDEYYGRRVIDDRSLSNLLQLRFSADTKSSETKQTDVLTE